jgi:hypothetical protein
MKTSRNLLIVGLALLAWRASAQLDPGNPLANLAKLKDFQTMRVLLFRPELEEWQRGRASDTARRHADLGYARWARSNRAYLVHHCHDDPFYSRLMTLRIYWDDEEHPSVECPIGDFFGIGHGVDKPFTSLPIRVSSDGRGRNSYWADAVSEEGRESTVTNESDKRCGAFFTTIFDWQKHPSLPKDSAYFHASVPPGSIRVVMGPELPVGRARRARVYLTWGRSKAFIWFLRAGMAKATISFLSMARREPSLRGNRHGRLFLRRLGVFREHVGTVL